MGLFSKLAGSSSKSQEAANEQAGEQSTSSLAPPPAYTSRGDARSASPSSDRSVASREGAAPDYVRPVFHDGGSAMALMPPTFSAYSSWTSTSKMHLGQSKEERQHHLTVGWNAFATKKPIITIHTGPSADDPPLAEVQMLKVKLKQDHNITVHTRPDRPGPPLIITAGFQSRSWRDWNVTFTVPIPSAPTADSKAPLPPRPEVFQWRTTTGEEVTATSNNSRWSSGWKLVWLTGPDAGEGVGFSSDGHEVVAVAARPTKGVRKVLTVTYMGTGLTGTLGADWEAIVAASALQLWWNDMQQHTNTAVAAGAAA